MLKKKLNMSLFWTLIMALWVTNEINWLIEGHEYAFPGLFIAALGIWACVSQWRLYFAWKKENQKTDTTGGNEK